MQISQRTFQSADVYKYAYVIRQTMVHNQMN